MVINCTPGVLLNCIETFLGWSFKVLRKSGLENFAELLEDMFVGTGNFLLLFGKRTTEYFWCIQVLKIFDRTSEERKRNFPPSFRVTLRNSVRKVLRSSLVPIMDRNIKILYCFLFLFSITCSLCLCFVAPFFSIFPLPFYYFPCSYFDFFWEVNSCKVIEFHMTVFQPWSAV